MPENIRTAVIGIGHMGSAHARCIAEGKVPGMVLSAVCDLAQDRLEWAEREFPEVRRFADWRELLAGNAADAAVGDKIDLTLGSGSLGCVVETRKLEHSCNP